VTVDAMPPAYDSVIDGIRAGIRQAKGAALSGADITDATPFWFSPDAERPSLSFDSLDFLELVVFLEEEFGWYVPEEQIDVNECRTVGDLAALVLKACADGPGVADA
jgi:acyl carrier protein